MRLMDEQAQFSEYVAQRTNDDNQANLMLVSGRISIERGLAVYRNNLRLAWRGALASTFPIMVRLLGEDGFALSARDYGEAYPSQSGDLSEYGRHYATFIKDYEPLYEYPYLPDVARLEWLWHQSHSTANHKPLLVDELMGQGATQWLSAQVLFASSAFLYKANHAAASIWLAHQEFGDLSLLRDNEAIFKPQYALVSRPLWRVEIRVLDEAAFVFLESLQSGSSFEQALLSVEQSGLPFDFVALLPVFIESGVWSKIIWMVE